MNTTTKSRDDAGNWAARGVVEGVIAQVAAADARLALQAAADAQAGWSATPPRTRSDVLYRTCQLMIERTDLLAELITLEMGNSTARLRT